MRDIEYSDWTRSHEDTDFAATESERYTFYGFDDFLAYIYENCVQSIRESLVLAGLACAGPIVTTIL